MAGLAQDAISVWLIDVLTAVRNDTTAIVPNTPLSPSPLPLPGQNQRKRKRAPDLVQPTSVRVAGLFRRRRAQSEPNPLPDSRKKPFNRQRATRPQTQHLFATMSDHPLQATETPTRNVHAPLYISGLQTPSTLTESSSGKVTSSDPRQHTKEQKEARNIHNERRSLAEHHMVFNDKQAWDTHDHSLRKTVEAILSRSRGSEMKEKSAKAAIKTLERYSTQNEITLFSHLLPKLIKSDRSVDTKKRDADDQSKYTIREFEEDGLMVIRDCRFIKNLLPGNNHTKEEKVMGLTAPVPDWTFGVEETEPHKDGQTLPKNVKALKHVASGVDWAFLVIETKSCAEGIAAAENQAMRDGAVLLNARLQLENLSRSENEQTQAAAVNRQLFVFSCSMTAEIAKLAIHWSENRDGGRDIFHMQPVRDYMLSWERELADLRHDIHNVIDWGLLEYRAAADATWAKISMLAAQ